MLKFKQHFVTIIAACCFAVLAITSTTQAQSLSERVDEIENHIDYLEDRVRSTLMSGGSTPVSFSGEARLKMQYHNLGFDAPAFMQTDRSYFQSGWEGNENLFRLGMIVRPGRNTVLWSRIGLQHTLTGNRFYNPDRSNWENDGNEGGEGFVPVQYRHDKTHNSISIHEDMSAGIAVRTEPASFWARMGNTMWTEASPLTVWKAQPRTFAWEYLPFEVEQPIARYYEYNIARGIKEGRAAWNKRPFNGFQLESITLPQDFYANFIYGTFERYDNFEREYIDFAGDLGYADGALGPFPFKGHGIGDSYRNVIHGRIARDRTLGNLMLGVNYVGINYSDDVIFAAKFDEQMDEGDPRNGIIRPLINEFRGYDSIFYKNSRVFSIDARGPVNDNLSLMVDVAMSMVDTVWAIDTASSRSAGRFFSERLRNPQWYEERSTVRGDLIPAVYTQLSYSGESRWLRGSIDAAYIHPGFYAPFSFVMPNDGFFAFGSNMVGAGKFMARGEGTPYVQNMTGAAITYDPELEGYGHFRLKYGLHANVNEDGRDVLFFPYRLHGSDMFSFFHSSFNRWGNGLIDNSTGPGGAGRFYRRRLGDESFAHIASYSTNAENRLVAGPSAGGLRSDFMSMYEGFVPYASALDAFLNFRVKNDLDPSYSNNNNPRPGSSGHNPSLSSITHHDLVVEHEGQTYTTSSSFVPTSRKWTNNIEVDAAYCIGRFVGYDKDLFVGGYAGLTNITRQDPSFIPLPGDEGGTDNTLLWSAYVRFEPAIALASNFYLLGLFGYETWRSEHAWALTNTAAWSGSDVNAIFPNPTEVEGTNSSLVNPANIRRMPINSVDIAYGIGFDWDMLARVGLHGRVKWMTHTDHGLNDFYDEVNRYRATEGLEPLDIKPEHRNDWSTMVVSLELKTWF